MKKEIILTFFATLIIFLSLSLISAELIISQPKSAYNFGDTFDVAIKIIPQKDTASFFTAALVCPENNIELYRSPIKLNVGEEKEIPISIELDKRIVTQGGKCKIQSSFDEESIESQSFDILSEIDLTINLDNFPYPPGQEIKVSGSATKVNSVPLNGFVEMSIPNLGITILRPVIEGAFVFNFTTPSSTKSQSYNVNVKVYEKDEFGGIINEGSTTTSFKIVQSPTDLDIALSSPTIKPNNAFLFTPIVYDQAGDKFESDVGYTVFNPQGTIIKKEIVKSGKTISLPIESNFPSGNWKIEASSLSLKKSKEFFVEEYRNISFTLINNTLNIINNGNVPFTGPIEISIGGINEIKELSLNTGESKKFKLLAPAGTYDIKINDGSSVAQLGSTFLTGKVISVGDAIDNSSSSKSNMIIVIWLIVILIIAIIAVFLYKKISRKTFVGKSPSSNINSSVASLPVKSSIAQSSNVTDKGDKQECSIVSVKIKNSEALKQYHEAASAIENSLYKAKEFGGKVYSEGDYRLVVLSPLLTKQQDNTDKAIKIANIIEKNLQEFNAKKLKKIDYGIGISLGNLIVDNKDNKFKFVSADNSIVSVKNISQFANNGILISESFHRKTIGKVKANKISDKNLWQIERVVDRSQHEDFINKFKQRQKSDRG